MKITKLLTAGFFAATLMLGSLQKAGAAGVSNLGEPTDASSQINVTQFFATRFVSGDVTGGETGFSLSGITLSMDDAFNTPSGFSVSIYSDASGTVGNSDLGDLNINTDPTTAGNYTYAPSSSVILSANTAYWVVVGATSDPTLTGSYLWNYPSTASYTFDTGWSIDNIFAISTDQGTSWDTTSGLGSYKFGVTTTTVPEPSTYALFALGALVLFWQVRRREVV